MTPRERLMAFLKGEPTDRVPIWLLFPYHPIGCYIDVRTNPCYTGIFQASIGQAVMLNRRHLRAPVFGQGVAEVVTTSGQGDDAVRRVEWRFGRRVLYSETGRRGGNTVLSRAISSQADLAAMLEFPIADEAAIRAELDRQLPAYLKEREEFPAENGAMMLDLGEPIGFVYNNSNLEELAIWSLTCPGLVEQLLERLMRRSRAVYRWCLQRELAEVYFLVGSELASPPMVNVATFCRWIVPHARELIAMIHAAGAFAIQHYHGQIREVLPHFLSMAPDALHTIEAPPTGNCTLRQAFDVVGEKIGLIGNIQYDCFRAYSRQEMDRAVRAVLEETRGRRFMLSPTAGPYEETISPQVIENYMQFLRTGWEAGKT